MFPAPQELRTYFVSTNTASRRRLFQVDTTASLLLEVILDHRAKNRLALHAFVIMPDHFHALLTPAPNVSLEKAMQFIKGGFSYRYKSKLDVWMRSFNESQILTREKFDACRTYIEANPVRKGWVSSAETFVHSSAHRPEVIDPRPAHLQ